jgi:hypothetical protein
MSDGASRRPQSRQTGAALVSATSRGPAAQASLRPHSAQTASALSETSRIISLAISPPSNDRRTMNDGRRADYDPAYRNSSFIIHRSSFLDAWCSSLAAKVYPGGFPVSEVGFGQVAHGVDGPVRIAVRDVGGVMNRP